MTKPEFQISAQNSKKMQKFEISSKRYFSLSSYSIILKFLLEKLGI